MRKSRKVASKEDGVGWIDHLYLHPSAVGKGIGTQLLNRAKEQLGSPIHLYTFQENVGSRRFYEPNGFSPIDYSNGATNEEKCPDVLYEFESKTSIPTTEDPEP